MLRPTDRLRPRLVHPSLCGICGICGIAPKLRQGRTSTQMRRIGHSIRMRGRMRDIDWASRPRHNEDCIGKQGEKGRADKE